MPRAYFLRTAKHLKAAIQRLDRLTETRDLPELHRLSVDLQTSLSENIVHENRKLLLDALRVNHEDKIAPYAERLRVRLEDLRREYLEKADRKK